MTPIFYTSSQKLRQNLQEFDSLSEAILGQSLDTSTRLRSEFETDMAKIYFSFLLSSVDIIKSDISDVITHKKETGKNTKAIDLYYQSLLGIKKELMLDASLVTPNFLLKLYEKSCGGRLLAQEYLIEIKHMLDYVQLSREHPLIKASLCELLFLQNELFTKNGQLFAHLLFELFVSKEKGPITKYFCVNHYRFEHRNDFEKKLQKAIHSENITEWLEYVTASSVEQLRFVKNALAQKAALFRTEVPKAFFKLTPRQQRIASLTDIPKAQITNRKIQQIFKVSQITASRDLSKLAVLGILEQQGHGRSVYYTKF